MASRKTPRDLLSPAALHILLALSTAALHGYGIKREVESRTEGRLRLGPGTLYEAIHRMEADGWIEEVLGQGGGRKRTYRITESGRTALQEELHRLDSIVRYARDAALLPS